MNRARRRHDTRFVRQLREGHGPRRPSLIAVAWWWRWEIGGAALLVAAIGALTCVTSWPIAVAAVVVGASVAVAPAASRNWLTGRFWAVIDQHRIRTALAEACVYSSSGRVPTILGARITPCGERVWLWCPAGLAHLDVLDVSDALAAACWARSVRVRHRRDHSQLVVIDVVRTSQQSCVESRWEDQS